jgi:hypothetical protein
MAEPAEIRAWARANGHDISARGAIPEHITAAYEAAAFQDSAAQRAGIDDYPDVSGGGVPYPPADMGVTEADFPPPLEDELVGETATPPKRERKPRTVKATRPSARKGWKNVFGGVTAKAKPRGTRTDLSEFAEDTWRDLALLSSGVMPPVSRVLTIQAPYAGVTFDQAVKGLPVVDSLLQPIARASVSLRALNGLFGPLVFTAGICVQGEWVTKTAAGPDGPVEVPVFGPDGRPVPTQRTAMMIGGLKYSLLQMSRTADLEKVQERAEVDAERMRAVDNLVDFILQYPRAPVPATGDGTPAPSSPGPSHPPSGQPGQVLTPSFVYPPPPQMDDTGAMV